MATDFEKQVQRLDKTLRKTNDLLDQLLGDLALAVSELFRFAEFLNERRQPSVAPGEREHAYAESPMTLTLPEAAKVLGVDVQVLYRIINQTGSLGPVPVVSVGRKRFVSAERLEEWINTGMVKVDIAQLT